MTKKLIILLVLLHTATTNSQNIFIEGTVKDTLNNPIVYANILAKPTDSLQELKFSITDSEGNYRLKLLEKVTYEINISYLGYKSIKRSISLSKDTTLNFTLEQTSELLDEIVIEMPIVVKGDTTIFKSDKFLTGDERKLKHVLKKLPGFEINRNGDVTVQGKKVTKLLVEGKKFFEGGTKLAIDNIPANAVDQVEVIDNYNEIAFLKDVVNSDDMAMNIVLKEDKKKFVFGDAEAAKGNKNFYKVHSNLFYYSPEISSNFIGNFNNTGEQVLSYRDYTRLNSRINSVFNRSFDFSGGEFGQFIESKDVTSSNQRFGAFSINKDLNSKLALNSYFILSKSETQSLLITQNDYTSFREDRQNDIGKSTFFGTGKLDVEFKPNQSQEWYFQTQIKRSNTNAEDGIISIINASENKIQTNIENTISSFKQTVEFHNEYNDKNIYSGVINYDYRANDQKSLWNTNNLILSGLIPVDESQEFINLKQLKETSDHSINFEIKNFRIINSSNHIYFSLGNRYINRKFVTIDSQILDNGFENSFSENGFGNDLALSFNNFFLGVDYKLKRGIFSIKQSLLLNNFTWEIDQTVNTKMNKWVLIPNFNLKVEFSKSKKINFNYGLGTSFSDVSNFAERIFIRSYNSVYQGNSQLENDLFHNLRLLYTRFSLFRGVSVIGNISYRKKIQGVINTVGFNGVDQFLTSKMFGNPSENLRLEGMIQKKISNIKYRLRGNALLSNFIQQIDDQNLTNKRRSYSLQFGLETSFDKFPNIDIGLKKTIGNYTTLSTTSFRTNEYSAEINYDFLDGFIFSLDYALFDYRNETLSQKNIYDIANTELNYRNDDSPWSYKVSVRNIFDINFKQSNSFLEYLISDTRTFILPRIATFSIVYNL